MSVVVEQAKWAMTLQMRELPPGGLSTAQDDPARWGDLDLRMIVRAYAWTLVNGKDLERLDAVRALAWLIDREAVPELIRALADGSAAVRCAAAHGLAGFCPLPGRAVDPLIAALADPDASTRAAAAAALGHARSPSAMAPLLAVVMNPSPSVRLAALGSLQRFGERGCHDPVAARRLLPLLDDDSPQLARAAYWAVAALGGSTVEAERAAWRWSDRGQSVWRQLGLA